MLPLTSTVVAAPGRDLSPDVLPAPAHRLVLPSELTASPRALRKKRGFVSGRTPRFAPATVPSCPGALGSVVHPQDGDGGRSRAGAGEGVGTYGRVCAAGGH